MNDERLLAVLTLLQLFANYRTKFAMGEVAQLAEQPHDSTEFGMSAVRNRPSPPKQR